MTKWRGETGFRQIGKGTALLIFQHPYVAGMPEAALTTGDTIQIRLGPPEEKLVEGSITVASDDGATVELADGTAWLMTPRQQGELGANITWQGGPSQEWTVRAQA